MPMYSLIEYSDNFSDKSQSLWKGKRYKVTDKNADLTIDNSQSFKKKAALLGKTANAVNNTNSSVKDAKIVVPLKYLSNFWRSLEMPLINCKVYLELNWIEDCILSSAGNTAKFAIYMSLKLLCLLKTVQIWQNNEMKDLKDQFIGIATKQNRQK